MAARRRRLRRFRRRARPKRRQMFRRRYRRFVSKRNRGRRRRLRRTRHVVSANVKGIDTVAYWNRLGTNLSDSNCATFNIYPFPSNPFGTLAPDNGGELLGGFVSSAQAADLQESRAHNYAPVKPAIIDGHTTLVQASSEIAKFAETFEEFRIVSCELTFMQNKRPGDGNTDTGISEGASNNIYLLYNYLDQVAPQDPKSFYGMFGIDSDNKYNQSLPYQYFQNWNDIAGISLESNRNTGRSGWHRKLLTPEKPVKLFWRPKHYPVGGSTGIWAPLYDGSALKMTSVAHPVQATHMTNGWVSCDFIRNVRDRTLNLFWTGPAILMVDTNTGVGGTYSVGPLGGAGNVFQKVFGITVKYFIKVQFRGIRTDRYLPTGNNSGEAVSANDSREPWDLPNYHPTFQFDGNEIS